MHIKNKIILLVSLFPLVISADLSDQQQGLLETLPPDQRASIEQKMIDQQKLKDEIDEVFEKESFMTERPELEDYSDEEGFCSECIYGYNFFKFAPSTFAPANNVPISKDYVLGPGDRFEISYYGNENKTIKPYVNRDGNLEIYKLGSINVSGLTFEEARNLLTNKVEKEMIGTEVSATISELRAITVYILGEAYQPGAYTLSALSSVTNALFQAGGVSENGSLRNISVKRNGIVVGEYDFYDLLLKGNVGSEIRLQDGDALFIPIIDSSVTLAGSFRRTGLFELKKGETLKDLVIFGGGFKTNVKDTPSIEINTINKIASTRDLIVAEGTLNELNNVLKDGDIVSVSELSSLNPRSIEIIGEVKFPGVYGISGDEKILDVIERAGGYTDSSFPDGGIFTRKSTALKQKEAFEMKADELEDMLISLTSIATTMGQAEVAQSEFIIVQNFINKLRKIEPVGRQQVNLRILDLKTDPFSNFDIEDGDKLYIPRRPNSVHVIGEVLHPSTLRYIPGKPVSFYVSEAGGITNEADEDKIFIINPNGSSRNYQKKLFGSGNTVLPGSVVVISRDYQAVKGVNFAKVIAPIVGQFATSIAAIAVISDN